MNAFKEMKEIRYNRRSSQNWKMHQLGTCDDVKYLIDIGFSHKAVDHVIISKLKKFYHQNMEHSSSVTVAINSQLRAHGFNHVQFWAHSLFIVPVYSIV
jgi:hypothetical protein